MKPGDLRRALRLRRQQLRGAVRRDLALMRQRARAASEAIRAGRGPTPRRRRLALAIPPLLLIAALLRCDCERTQPVKLEPKGETRVAAKAPPEKAAQPRPPRKGGRGPLAGEVDRRPRPGYETKAQLPPDWIDELRLQATARSPRLAQCFAGTDRPGALRWVAALNPETGTVSDQELEPVGPRSTLTTEQRLCVARALADPAYRLSRPPAQPFPERVSLVIEF
jgi:hypothetical protein